MITKADQRRAGRIQAASARLNNVALRCQRDLERAEARLRAALHAAERAGLVCEFSLGQSDQRLLFAQGLRGNTYGAYLVKRPAELVEPKAVRS